MSCPPCCPPRRGLDAVKAGVIQISDCSGVGACLEHQTRRSFGAGQTPVEQASWLLLGSVVSSPSPKCCASRLLKTAVTQVCSRDDSAFRKRTLSLTQRGRGKKGLFSSLKGLDTLARRGKEKRPSLTQASSDRPRGKPLVRPPGPAACHKRSLCVENEIKVGSKDRDLSLDFSPNETHKSVHLL